MQRVANSCHEQTLINDWTEAFSTPTAKLLFMKSTSPLRPLAVTAVLLPLSFSFAACGTADPVLSAEQLEAALIDEPDTGVEGLQQVSVHSEAHTENDTGDVSATTELPTSDNQQCSDAWQKQQELPSGQVVNNAVGEYLVGDLQDMMSGTSLPKTMTVVLMSLVEGEQPGTVDAQADIGEKCDGETVTSGDSTMAIQNIEEGNGYRAQLPSEVGTIDIVLVGEQVSDNNSVMILATGVSDEEALQVLNAQVASLEETIENAD